MPYIPTEPSIINKKHCPTHCKPCGPFKDYRVEKLRLLLVLLYNDHKIQLLKNSSEKITKFSRRLAVGLNKHPHTFVSEYT